MTDPALASLLPLPVAFPLAGAVMAPLLARVSRRLPVFVGAGALLASLAVLLLLAPTVFRGRVLVHFMGHWTPVDGAALGIAFAGEPFGLALALAFAGIGVLLLVSTLSELGGLGGRELGGYACLVQLLIAALIGAALTADLFNLFVWFEVAGLASFGLTGFFLERPIALEAAFKILVLTTLASFAIFIGAGLLYAEHGALNFAQLRNALDQHTSTSDRVALALLIGGFATKAGLVPFHGWLADAHTAAPGPVSALFSGLMVNLGIIGIVRVVFYVHGPHGLPLLGVLMAVGLASALLGAAMALVQDDLKRLLAYDTISQMGIVIAGFASGTASGVAGGTYHLLNHALFKSLLFLCAGAIVHRTGFTRLSELGGLARRSPALALAFVVGVASIAGIPPLGGYVSLTLIHDGLRESHQTAAYVLMLIAQLITIAALGRAGWLAFFRRRDDEYEHEEALKPGMVTALSALGGCCIAFGVLPRIFLDHVAAPAAASVLHATEYAKGVLGGGVKLPALSVSMTYLSALEFSVVAASVILAALLARAYLRTRREPFVLRILQAVHNGSVHDYAGYAAFGLILITGLLWLPVGSH